MTDNKAFKSSRKMKFLTFSSSSSFFLLFFFFFFFLLFSVISAYSQPTHPWKTTSINKEQYSEMELPSGLFGPESLAFDCHGEGPYAGVSDGRILKWKGPILGWTQFAVTSPNRKGKMCDGSNDTTREATCGRPLGLKFKASSCNLYIADAYFGLMIVGPKGGLAKKLANSADGVPFHFTNALDINSQTGEVYFTDTSIMFQRRVWLQSIINGDKTGRLLKYDPRTKNVTVLLNGLAFPNGVALSKDNSFILMAETATFKILKFWLKGPKSQTTEIFAQLQRFPDNIKRNENGDFWVAMNSGRGEISGQKLTELMRSSSERRGDVKIPWLRTDPVAVKFDEGGAVKTVLDGAEGAALESVSEVEEGNDGKLWIGSVVKPYVGVLHSS